MIWSRPHKHRLLKGAPPLLEKNRVVFEYTDVSKHCNARILVNVSITDLASFGVGQKKSNRRR
ncbi:hypothetical protein CHS0354_038244 [Potamilus streckersoni]|uniref:Uncharacterized protein n=1 Tax=Potamilus streckersoni TaxID=2493646 RepID=A0AAE0T140_9BIVA|nr:hypothetical protein CHS0354_038244 [Potamilus streckersoni]